MSKGFDIGIGGKLLNYIARDVACKAIKLKHNF